jgi:hypothetical protein
MFINDTTASTGAVISKNQLYRYVLWRIWNERRERVNFIMLNPSTAGKTENDHTIIRCINYALYWGFGGMYVTNLFAFRSTDPNKMKSAPHPIGRLNNKYLKRYSEKCPMVILAWGRDGCFKNRDEEVLKLIGEKDKIYCIEKSSIGFPKHPARLAGHLKPMPFY